MSYPDELLIQSLKCGGFFFFSPILFRQTIYCYYMVNKTQTVAFSHKPRSDNPRAEIGTGLLMVQMRQAQGKWQSVCYKVENLTSVLFRCIHCLSVLIELLFQMLLISTFTKLKIIHWRNTWETPCFLRWCWCSQQTPIWSSSWKTAGLLFKKTGHLYPNGTSLWTGDGISKCQSGKSPLQLCSPANFAIV